MTSTPIPSDSVNSDESEGEFNTFIDEQLTDMIDGILTDGGLESIGEPGSDLIIEIDDIVPPTFVYGEEGEGAGGGGSGPGQDKGKLRFSVPFETLMELISQKLKLPDLTKEGKGRIKEVSYVFKTFGTTGVILDKKRTFKQALKTSIALGNYNPEKEKFDVLIRKKDKRFKLPLREEKPKYRAVVFYLGDISYSTYGSRLELEKRVVNFIHQWLDYNYGPRNVEHRFIVHDVEAYEVLPEEFYRVSNAGGTRASIAFDLAAQIAMNEYDVQSTNFYGFYFGDGELFSDDARQIVKILDERLWPIFNRFGVVEVQPSRASHLNSQVNARFYRDKKIRIADLQRKQDILDVIKILFGERTK